MIRSVSSGLEAATTDDAYAGPPLGATASGSVGSFNHRALALEVGVGGQHGNAVHRHDLALGCLQAGHGARVALIALGAEPFARV